MLRTATASAIFTPVVLEMIAVGEETGELDSLMAEVADMYEREVDYDIKNLAANIEPILTIALGIHAARLSLWSLANRLLEVTILFGLAFLVLKGVEYRHHLAEGIGPGPFYRFAGLPARGAALFFTLYYLMTGLHALHVAAGVAALTWMRLRPVTVVQLELGGLYWHLVDLVWIFLWPLLYLVR